MTAEPSVTDELDALVRQVPGVDLLYPAGSIVGNALSATIDTMARRLPLAPKVAVEEGTAGLHIKVKIGVSATGSSSDISRRVHDAIAAHLLQNGNPPVAKIEVIVACIG